MWYMQRYHRVFTCSKLKPGGTDALKLVIAKELCINCLYKHDVSVCTSKFSCRTCQQKHHTLLHEAFDVVDTHMLSINQAHLEQRNRRAMLATALIPVITKTGETSIRALIDPGSTANLLSERGAQLLQCKRHKIANVPMYGIGNTKTGTASHRTSITIGSMYDGEFKLAIDAYITPKITAVRPIPSHTSTEWSHLRGLQLADPNFVNGGPIDLLIGVCTYAELLESGLVRGQPNEPIAQKTRLGWITAGQYDSDVFVNFNHIFEISDETKLHDEPIHINMMSNEDISDQIKMFWELEGVKPRKLWTEAEQACEESFTRTVTRAPDGKLMMRLPFNTDTESPDFLGESIEQAKHRFFQLERRFARNPTLKEEYTKCINEYIELGHAVEVPMKQYTHIIPHHAVFKESSTTTKTRVVFDASAKTTNGHSLNDRMHIGPTILEDLWAVLLRWRMGRIALTADIEKMYRQFWIHPGDTKYQQILWRDDPNKPLKLYELRTVTFGTSGAPSLAIRCIQYIAEALEKENPELTEAIIKSFYVDDWFKSFDTVDEAIRIKNRITKIFESYGLNLRKWNSNAGEIINEQIVEVKTDPQNTTTALGLQWYTETDQLGYKISLKQEPEITTKRTVLSEISSLYDPLGLLAPIIMGAKAFMQQLWLGRFTWDEPLANELIQEWKTVRASLLRCAEIRVPRWVGYKTKHKNLSLHVFCDASERAYAAALYLRTVDENDMVKIQLLTAKTKITPLKRVSIPRLELCAAHLLAKLMDKFLKSVKMPQVTIYAWTNSAITLAWIATQPYKLKTFVANSVSEIQEKIRAENWRHVGSTLNPADYATRCQPVGEIASLSGWWNGPTFLREDPEKWPKTPHHMVPKKIPETKILHQQIEEPPTESSFLLKYSSLNHLLNITAYVTRWLKTKRNFRGGKNLSPLELIEAKKTWTRYVQGLHYPKEMHNLQVKKPVSNRSPLLSLTPYLDEDGIIRVGGRLQNSLLSYNGKHPVILPTKSHFTQLIVRQAHYKTLHGGLQATLRTVRDEFWIVRGPVTIKTALKRCMTCFRDHCRPAQQQMADLLSPQVQPNRPFSHVGVDFAGYFEIKLSTKRNAGTTKCYIALFICLTTKALHLELAHNLSTEAFLATLNRFISRRGIPSDIYSDRGTNFLGTANQLPELWYQEDSEESRMISRECVNQGITWHFNPARASHFGGLWEAGVKSVKTHLYRMIGELKLRYEEFNTLIIQIEACLNSRPLCPMNDDPDNLEALTPSHFLIGQALVTTPHPDMRYITMNRLSQFQFMQRLLQQFWEHWSREYLTRLQQRPKWKQQHPNLEIG